jgi:hypothetical protein
VAYTLLTLAASDDDLVPSIGRSVLSVAIDRNRTLEALHVDLLAVGAGLDLSSEVLAGGKLVIVVLITDEDGLLRGRRR